MELVGAACFLVIFLAFYFLRKGFLLYNIVCLSATAAFAVVCRDHALTGEWLLMILGLLLYWFGMMAVRVMFTRSVSLNTLFSYRDGNPAQSMQEDIAGRLEDATRFRLIIASQDDPHYRLTAFGRLCSFVVVVGYWLLRVER